MAKVNVINKSDNQLPKYVHEGDAGCDIRANLKDFRLSYSINTVVHDCTWKKLEDSHVVDVIKSIEIMPFGRALIPTGLFVDFSEKYELQVRPKSGLAIKHGITVLNSPGCIDANYRDEIKVILINLGERPFIINDGDRIAQFILSPIEPIEWVENTKLNESTRDGGFGSTGIK